MKGSSIEHQRILKTTNEQIKLSKRNEVIVLGIETDKKKIDVGNTYVYRTKMEEIDVNYSAQFWNTVNLPPATDYFKKSVKELESNFGIPIDTQFELVNK